MALYSRARLDRPASGKRLIHFQTLLRAIAAGFFVALSGCAMPGYSIEIIVSRHRSGDPDGGRASSLAYRDAAQTRRRTDL